MTKKLKIVVLAKQVPDTRNVGKNAMTPEGTVNRAALPAIFNPEDMNALEQALYIKDQNPGSEVLLLTMGPFRAADVIREGLFRGADGGILLTDRKFAGADTLATSYALSQAIGYSVDKAILYGRNSASTQKMPLGIVTRLAQTSEPASYPATARPWADLHTSNIISISSGVTGAALFHRSHWQAARQKAHTAVAKKYGL